MYNEFNFKKEKKYVIKLSVTTENRFKICKILNLRLNNLFTALYITATIPNLIHVSDY